MDITYHILWIYFYNYWKDKNLSSDKMQFYCISLLVLVFVTTSHGDHMDVGRRASRFERCLLNWSDDYRPGNVFTTEDGCYECKADSNCRLSCTTTDRCFDKQRSLHCPGNRRFRILKGCYTCWEDASCNLSCTRNEQCVDRTEQCLLNGHRYQVNKWRADLSRYPDMCMCKFDFECVISRCMCQ